MKTQTVYNRLEELFTKNPRKVFSLKKIFKYLGVHQKSQRLQIVDELEKLLDRHKISMSRDGNFRLKDPKNAKESRRERLVGKVDYVNPRYAFIVCEGQEKDIWVNEDDLNYALNGDTVEVVVFPNSRKNRPQGAVSKIIERKTDEFVGRIDISKQFAFVVADSKRMHLDIFVPKNKIGKASDGDKVIVKIDKWHTDKDSPTGYVKTVLGKAGENEAEMHAILAEFDLPYHFPKEVLQAAEKIKGNISQTEIKKRRDLRNVLTFTIDPADAKDFDDALSIQKLDNGNWEIGIHIADVTHYVKPNSLIEQEAVKRATSVYLVDRVVPMLPERLSNELCSLRPHEDKLTFSAIFEINEQAQVLNQWFGRTIIHSDQRFSYEEAQEVLDTGKGQFFEPLHTLNEFAKKLKSQRFKEGAINFETIEVKFKLGENAKPIGIFIKERKDTHKLIEEFMLLANRKVAEFVFFHKNGKQNNPMVYRTHDKPDPDKLQNFSKFAGKFGYDVKVTDRLSISHSLNHLIDKIEGTKQQNVLESLAIRTMAKAIYTTQATGHFGLAFEHYTHFTSPIRRYPDMMVHRLLHKYLKAYPVGEQEVYESQAKHSTEMEKRAADAERASIKYKQVEFMQDAEDKVFAGVITGVSEWGAYVEIVETKCEGMVRMQDMLDDFYELDEENYRLIGRQSKNIIAFGDEVQVRVKSANLGNRTLDLLFE